MHFTFRNIEEAFCKLVKGIDFEDIPTELESSRNGNVLRIEEPVTITYERPWERVLFNPARDCNPTFHVFEALWMLAGRNDVKSLVYYNSKMGQYSDDEKTFNGAYGYRWRNVQPRVIDTDYYIMVEDQLDELIKHLHKIPNSRRAVLSMWNVEDDLLKVDDSKDVACNLCCVFQMNNGYLDMTVYNRSNDFVMGSLGANHVHFSYLLEYMACALGVEMGRYHQVTCNLHIYTNNWKPQEWLQYRPDVYPSISKHGHCMPDIPLVQNREVFDEEVVAFCDDPCGGPWQEPFLQQVASPMMQAFAYHKEERDYPKAIDTAGQIALADWHIAAVQWLQRRQVRWEAKQRAVV